MLAPVIYDVYNITVQYYNNRYRSSKLTITGCLTMYSPSTYTATVSMQPVSIELSDIRWMLLDFIYASDPIDRGGGHATQIFINSGRYGFNRFICPYRNNTIGSKLVARWRCDLYRGQIPIQVSTAQNANSRTMCII